MSRKRILVIAAAVTIAVIAAVVVVLLVRQSADDSRRPARAAATSTTGVTSPYDFTELPAGTDLAVIEGASFVSILVPNDSGAPTGYGIDSDTPAAQALAKAVVDASEVDDPSEGPATTGAAALTPTLAFVLATRETLTFALDLDRGLISRGGRTWRPAGDLAALIRTATAQPR